MTHAPLISFFCRAARPLSLFQDGWSSAQTLTCNKGGGGGGPRCDPQIDCS